MLRTVRARLTPKHIVVEGFAYDGSYVGAVARSGGTEDETLGGAVDVVKELDEKGKP